MRRNVLLLLFLCGMTSSEVRGSMDRIVRGTRSAGLGSAGVALTDDVWQVYRNPAGLASLRDIRFASFYVPQYFGVPDLRTVALVGGVPAFGGGVALAVEQFGFELYRETSVAVGSGMFFDKNTAGGVTLLLTRTAIPGYGSTTTVQFHAGVSAELADRFLIGAAAMNVTGSTIGRNRERLPQQLMVGGSYRAADGLTVVLEMEKDIRYPLVGKAGLEYTPVEGVTVRGGIASAPDLSSLGLAFGIGGVEFSYAGIHHPNLGWTHGIEVQFRFGE